MAIKRPEQVKVNISWKEIDYACDYITQQIKNSRKRFKNIYGLPRGGLVVAVILSHKLRIPNVVTSIIDTNLNETLVVDDITDSGRTLLHFNGISKNIATLFRKKKSEVRPKFYYKIVPEKHWIVFPWEGV